MELNLKKVGVVILNYKNWEDTIDCIKSFENQEYLNYRIIVVENASGNDSAIRIKQGVNEQGRSTKEISINDIFEENMESDIKCNDILLVETNENLGFSGGNNIGAIISENIGCEYTLLLNSDTVITDRDFLCKLVEPLEDDEHAYVIGPNILNYDGTYDSPFKKDSFFGDVLFSGLLNKFRQLQSLPSYYLDVHSLSSPFVSEVYRVSGACMMVKARWFKSVGRLDENVWLSCEEAILAEKVIRSNGKILFQPITTLIHKKAQSPRPRSDKYSIMKNHYKQRLYFYVEYKRYNRLQMVMVRAVFKLRLFIIRIMANDK